MSGEVLVRPARAGDDVSSVVRDAFGDQGDQLVALWAELEVSDLLRGSLVAEVDGSVVGHVGLSHAWVDARRELLDVWLLSPLGVVRTQQGSGIGTRLLAAAVDEARASGTPLLFLEGDPGYYGARGFERADRLGFAPASARTPAPAFQVVRFDSHEEWMTGQLVYRDIWWRHDAAGLRDPMLAEIEELLR
ncbi:MAG: GNAT family N-acetyltransferase [Marmoricola sp.]